MERKKVEIRGREQRGKNKGGEKLKKREGRDRVPNSHFWLRTSD